MPRTPTPLLRRNARPLLVLSWDGIVWQAAVLPAELILEPETCDAQVVTELKRWRGVADSAQQALEACLAHPQMESAPALSGLICCLPQVHQQLLSLPIDPQRPPPPHAFAAAVNYQLRDHLQSSTWSRSIGAALVAAGHLQPEQVEAVLAEVRGSQQRWMQRDAVDYAEDDAFDVMADAPDIVDEQPPSGMTRSWSQTKGNVPVNNQRFGDAACAMELINRSQLNEAIARQTLSLSSDEALSVIDMTCGWQSVGVGEAKQHRWPYAAAAMLRSERDALTRSADAAGLRLLGVMPLMLSAVGMLPAASSTSLVQIHHGVVGVAQLRDGIVRDSAIHSIPDAKPTARYIAPLIESSRGSVVVAGDLLDEGFLQELRQLSGLDVTFAAHPGPESAALLGAARLYAGCLQPRPVAMVPARDQIQRWWQRPGLWIGGGAVAGFALFMGIQITATSLENRINNPRALEDSPQQQELHELQQQVAQERRRLRDLSNPRASRQGMQGTARVWHDLLHALAHSHQAGIRIHRIIGEDPEQGVRLYGLAQNMQISQSWYQRMSRKAQEGGWQIEAWQISEDRPHSFSLGLRAPLSALSQQDGR